MVKRLALVPLLAVVVAACAGSSTTTPSNPPASVQTTAPTEAAAPSETPSPSVAPTAEPPSPSPETSAAAGPAGEAFVDPEGMYRLTVPESWEPRHGALAQGIEVWLTHPAADGFSPNVNVLTQAVGDMTLDEYTQASIDNAPAFIQDFELGETRTVTGPGGGELAVVEYSGRAGGAQNPLRFLAVWTVYEGNAIVTTFTTLT